LLIFDVGFILKIHKNGENDLKNAYRLRVIS
jgi:hypothetical protein